jgi:hypothetical protein
MHPAQHLAFSCLSSFLFAAQLAGMVPLGDVKEALAQARATSRAKMEEALAAAGAASAAQAAQITQQLEGARHELGVAKAGEQAARVSV